MSELSSEPGGAARPRVWWQRPAVLSLLAVLLLLAAALALPVWRMFSANGPAPAPQAPNLPWQVQPLPDGGSRVFELELGRFNLGQTSARFAGELTLGVIALSGQPPALEAFLDSFQAGFVSGKLVLAFEADASWLAQARERAPRQEVTEGGRGRRYTLSREDEMQAHSSRLVALAFLPAARLDEAVVVQRFGAPAEKLTGPAGETQLFYPALGVAVVLPPADGPTSKAKTVIQYTAPAEFERRLAAPLRAAVRAASAVAR